MHQKIFLLTLFLSLPSLTSAMEIGTDAIAPQTDSGFHKVPQDILAPLIIELASQSRANLFSTCRAWNHYGLTVYYPVKYPDFDTINWDKLSFPTQEEKNRFTLLVLFAVKSFHNLSFKKPEMTSDEATEILKKWAPQKKELKSKSKSDQLEKLCEIYTAKALLKQYNCGINLASLSEHIITQVKIANALYTKNNPSDQLSSFIRSFSEEEHPLMPLFNWIQECALGNVIVQYSYNPDDRPITTYDHGLPIVNMSRLAKKFLLNYRYYGVEFLNSTDLKTSGEYGLHVLLFNKWRALSDFTANNVFDMNCQKHFKITDSCGLSYRLLNNYIEIHRIPEEIFEQKAHPIFVKIFKEINEIKKYLRT